MKIRLLLIVLVAGLTLSCGKRTPTLNLLVWEGYADPLFVKAFEEQNHCKVSASYMGSSDELVAKLRGGSAGNYDVISPSSDVATMISEAELAAPLDLAKLPSYEQLSPKLRSMPLVRVNGKVDEIAVSFFLIGRDKTLLLEICGRLRRGITPEINAVSTIIFAFSLCAIVLWYRLSIRAQSEPVIAPTLPQIQTEP